MKAAVTAERGALSAPIDPRFGRARWFVVVDTVTGEVETHDNHRAAAAEHGAGVRAARRLIELGVKALVTGNMGPNAFNALQAAGVDVYLTYAGTVQRTVERLKAGRLSRATRPSKQGHG